ncbi:hypothetical protein [Phosphitispora sp. TUW77]|uniref:hypothetical protein n=1 Tax=Phosphitispora sp. TUW77 TaxID=3152361 RepID=UPI003AB79364
MKRGEFMNQPDAKHMENVKQLGEKIARAYVDGLKEIGGDVTKSWVCGAVCGGGCSAGCGGGCVGGCAADGPIPVGDVYAAGGAGGASGGVATGVAEGY